MHRGFTDPLSWHFPPGRQVHQRLLPDVLAQLPAIGDKQTDEWKFDDCTKQQDTPERNKIREIYRVSCCNLFQNYINPI